MHRVGAKRIAVAVLCGAVLTAGLPATGHAGMIGTASLVETPTLSESQSLAQAILTRDAVREQILALGADPAEVEQRLAALTPEELRQIEQDIDDMPAGGILGVIGVVFIVLIILELVGAIDIFKKV